MADMLQLLDLFSMLCLWLLLCWQS